VRTPMASLSAAWCDTCRLIALGALQND
jgi:hypothetical protein